MLLLAVSVYGQVKVSGTVYDKELPLAGVPVSDGIHVVLTDSEGHYVLDCSPKVENIFITTPSGYVPASKDGVRPDFYVRLKKDGSEEVHDFVLKKEDQTDYSVIFMTDLHLTGADFKPDTQVFVEQAMPSIRRQAEAAAEHGPVYAFNLGDFSHERYWYECDYNLEDAFKTFYDADFPVLMYSVPGNHDNDCAVSTSDTDWDAGHLYRKIFGPEYYSVNIGKDHWLFMDDIIYINGPFKPNKKRAPGAAGSLSYEKGFTKEQMDWLAQDLAYVPDSARVFICTHSPIVSDSKKGYTFRQGQLDTLSSMFSRFGNVKVYAGHMHRMYFKRSEKFPIFETSVLVATSGDMWESEPNRLLGIEGEDGGVFVVNHLAEGDRFTYYSHLYGEKVMRIYDLNPVRKHYMKDQAVREQMKTYPERIDYADKAYENMILVNYWMYEAGHKVEIYEDGRQLEVRKVNHEDPLFNVSYYTHAFLGKRPIAPGQKTVGNHHAFAAKASSKRGQIVVKVLDAEGNLLYEETMKRPKAFKLDME